MNRAIKCRIDPTREQRVLFEKTFGCCGEIKEDLKLSDRIFICECGNVMDRDVNAAINIKMEAMRLKAS